MSNILARCYYGAQDLYHGIPELKDAVIIDVIRDADSKDYRTTLVLKDVHGTIHHITIAQAN